MSNKKECSTCKYCSYREKNGQVQNDGYCHYEPVKLGTVRPKLNLRDLACHVYEPREYK